MPIIDYADFLDEVGLDWLRVRIATDRGLVTNFTVQYETVIDGRRLAVIRYDCAHGFPHVDILDRRGDVVTKVPLPESLPLKMVLEMGIADIKGNWKRYQERFLGERQ